MVHLLRFFSSGECRKVLKEVMIELDFWVDSRGAYSEMFIMKKLKIEGFLKLFLVNEVLKLPNIFLVRVVPKALLIVLLSHGLLMNFYLFQYYYLTPISNNDLILNKRQVLLFFFPQRVGQVKNEKNA